MNCVTTNGLDTGSRARLFSSLVTGLIAFVLFCRTGVDPASARDLSPYLIQDIHPGEQIDDRPPSRDVPSASRGVGDTLSFGFVDSEGFAVSGEVWTFDHGSPDPLEGWNVVDRTAQVGIFFRHITTGIWENGDAGNGNVPTDNQVAAPVLSGVGSAWVGAFQSEADDFCWPSGLGYGNSWCQRLLGPVLDHDGSSVITGQFTYFNDTERDYDYSNVIVQTLPSGNETLIARFTDQAGLAADHPTSPPVGATYQFDFSDFGNDTQFRVIFEMTSDGSWSDEDSYFVTEYGPLAVDDVVLGNTGPTGDTEVVYDFESDLQGWTPDPCPGVGSFEGIADISTYALGDVCGCSLTDNVLEFHNDEFTFPPDHRIQAKSPPVDVENDVAGVLSGPGRLEIFADWKQYSEMPTDAGVYFRPGWEYYPAVCPATGELQWSGRVGSANFRSTGRDPICFELRDVATDHGVPSDVEQIRFIYEIVDGCGAFCPPGCCEQDPKLGPLIDDVQIRFTRVPAAPTVAFGSHGQFIDGFSQSTLLDPNEPGNADVALNINGGNEPPLINGDSLFIEGPQPTPATAYDTRLWFRVARQGPGITAAGYDAWRTRVQQDGGLDAVDGITDIEAGEFATAKMDSAQVNIIPVTNRFHSYFIEEDARFDAGAGERGDANEIIADGILLPGTQIEYFVSSNYISTPDDMYLLPDTTGGFYNEFEILPGWRTDIGVPKFPCLLYIDAYNRGAQFYIENALDALGLEADRYDYGGTGGATPMARGLDPQSNNGCTIYQLLGYRGLLINTGTNWTPLWEEDYQMFSDWLTALSCQAGASVRGLILNGDDVGTALASFGNGFLAGNLGVDLLASTYSDWGGAPDTDYCVQLEAPSVGAVPYGTLHSQADYSYDAWGNGCPENFRFDVLGVVGSGVGNRAYVNRTTGEETFYSQVVRQAGAEEGNYRTVVDGVSWHHLSDRDVGGECVADSAHVVRAVANEIQAALEWIFGAGTIPSLCVSPCSEDDPADVAGPGQMGSVTRLFQNSPNPFHPYTTLRFSIASGGPVELAIYDVGGRRVHILVDEVLEPGPHEVVWDGTDDAGLDLPSGVYWSQLQTLGHKSNKRMILLRR